MTLNNLVETKEMIIVCGSGGTGKTTVAASLGAAVAAQSTAKVLVLTVDPARRLATAMGLADTGSGPVLVPSNAFVRHDQPHGELWVSMLDTKAGWDDLIRRHAADPAMAATVLANPLYANITSRFVHSHDYLAIEQLHAVHSSGDYDVIIVDTPPSRNALAILDAPQRMSEFFGGRLLRWLTVPYRSRLFTAASQPFYVVADRVLGSRFLRDVAEFFMLFQSMERGFVHRANHVKRLLVDDRTTFVVVSTLDAAPAHEARRLVDELAARSMPLGAVVFNRTVPTDVCSAEAAHAAEEMSATAADAAWVRRAAKASGLATADVAGVLGIIADTFPRLATLAGREAERRAEIADTVRGRHVALVDVPLLDTDVTDLDAIIEVGGSLIAPARQRFR